MSSRFPRGLLLLVPHVLWFGSSISSSAGALGEIERLWFRKKDSCLKRHRHTTATAHCELHSRAVCWVGLQWVDVACTGRASSSWGRTSCSMSARERGGGRAPGNQDAGTPGREGEGNKGGGDGSSPPASGGADGSVGGNDGGGSSPGASAADKGLAAALERQFSRPSAPVHELSEGMGKRSPSPRQRLRLQQENLDLRWRMSQKQNATVRCRQCAGEGVCECRFCAGTGLFKIGSDLMLDHETGRPPSCPVCRGEGVETCTRCTGAGRIATWLFRSKRMGDLSEDRG